MRQLQDDETAARRRNGELPASAPEADEFSHGTASHGNGSANSTRSIAAVLRLMRAPASATKEYFVGEPADPPGNLETTKPEPGNLGEQIRKAAKARKEAK